MYNTHKIVLHCYCVVLGAYGCLLFTHMSLKQSVFL